MIGFEKTSAVVTGASSGIGRAISVALAEAGVARQVIHYRANRDGAEQTSSMIEASGGEATIVQCDLSIAADRSRLVDTAFSKLGQIQTWVNNAGADVLTGDAASLAFSDKLQRLLDVDLVGTIDLSRMVADRLHQQSSSSSPPSMVFIGWDQAPYGMEGGGDGIRIEPRTNGCTEGSGQHNRSRLDSNVLGRIEQSVLGPTSEVSIFDETVGQARRRCQSSLVRSRSGEHVSNRTNHRTQRRLEPEGEV